MKTICLFISGLATLALTAQEPSIPRAKRERITEVMKHHIGQGIPGLALTVYSPSIGYWSHTEGISNLETGTPLKDENLFYLQSVSKTYMAVAILRLYEGGRIALNDPVTRYLDYPWMKGMEGIERVTVQMLLNHTSGLPEYSTEPRLVSRIIQDPLTVLNPEEMLSYLEGYPMESEPGSEYAYRNTNYELLSVIADKITGDHQAFIRKEILEPLGLQHTYILNPENYLGINGIADAYWDVLMEGRPANISGMQKANVASMKGDDGMVATTRDAVDFFKGLAGGNLLKPETLALMQEWVTDSTGAPRYGLGLTYYDLDVTYAIGHSGGGIGAGCVLLYLPEMDTILFLATNFNTMMESPIRKQNEDLQMNLLQALFAD